MFQLLHKDKSCKARLGKLTTAHGEINTPVFMPVGTQGTVKAISNDELKGIGAEIILGNAYHLYLRRRRRRYRSLRCFGNYSKIR